MSKTVSVLQEAEPAYPPWAPGFSPVFILVEFVLPIYSVFCVFFFFSVSFWVVCTQYSLFLWIVNS